MVSGENPFAAPRSVPKEASTALLFSELARATVKRNVANSIKHNAAILLVLKVTINLLFEVLQRTALARL
jgi:hypothetical protein